MARPAFDENCLFWQSIIAFMLIVSAVVFQVFHFYNNAWLIQTNESFTYQRGLGDDCVKNKQFVEGIKCSKWYDSKSTFVINGEDIVEADVKPPAIGLRIARSLLLLSTVLYLIVVFSLFFTCVKRDLRVQKLLCGTNLLLVFINFLAIIFVIFSSRNQFIDKKGDVGLGSAFYYFFLSNLLLWIGTMAHFNSWLDVYSDLQRANLSLRHRARAHITVERPMHSFTCT